MAHIEINPARLALMQSSVPTSPPQGSSTRGRGAIGRAKDHRGTYAGSGQKCQNRRWGRQGPQSSGGNAIDIPERNPAKGKKTIFDEESMVDVVIQSSTPDKCDTPQSPAKLGREKKRKRNGLTRTDGETRDLTIRKRLRSDDPKHVEPQKAQALVEETTSRDSVSTDGELGLSEKEKKAAKKARKAEKKARKAEKQERKTEKQERKAKMEQKSKGSRKSQTENNSDAAIKVGGTNPEVIHL